jgi:type II secretory pathway pseudopilin PulG
MRYHPRAGFTIIELITIMAVMGVMMGMIAPRLRVSPTQQVKVAARQMMRDVELARSRSLAMKSLTRLQFDTGSQRYEAFVDLDRDGTIDGSAAEREAIRAFGIRALGPQVRFGRGSAPSIPGGVGTDAVTFTDQRIEFDSRGLPAPFGTRGTVYVTSAVAADVVFAIDFSGAGSVRLWEYRQGGWQ